MTESIEHPILFAPRLVRALLAGRKTQTRRVIRPFPPACCDKFTDGLFRVPGAAYGVARRCPYGKAGHTLWVREAWSVNTAYEAVAPRDIFHDAAVWYRADGRVRGRPGAKRDGHRGRGRPSIHMPRWASRTDLRVTAVRAERLQEITTEDCIAEGLSTELREGEAEGHLRDQFRDGWDSINGGPGRDWASNPWLWVVSFDPPEQLP